MRTWDSCTESRSGEDKAQTLAVRVTSREAGGREEVTPATGGSGSSRCTYASSTRTATPAVNNHPRHTDLRNIPVINLHTLHPHPSLHTHSSHPSPAPRHVSARLPPHRLFSLPSFDVLPDSGKRVQPAPVSVQSQRKTPSFLVLGCPTAYLFLPLESARHARMCANISIRTCRGCARACAAAVDVVVPPE